MPGIEISDRARKLYRDSLVWDDHSGFDPEGGAHRLEQLQRWTKSGVHYLSVNVGYDVIDWRTSLKVLAGFRGWLQHRPQQYILVETADDILRAKREGKLAVAFDLEGMNALDGNVDMVNVYYALGVRQMLFAYNLNNLVGGGCHDADTGLTPLGRAVIREMNRVGMLVDCSHTAYRTTMEAMDVSEAPVIFSHSCAKALWKHGRNITDEQIKACARTGGVVGINGIGNFLGRNDISSGKFVDHVAHVAGLVGAAHVGVSLDYAFDAENVDGLVANNSRFWPKEEYQTASLYLPPEQLPEIVETMLQRGFSDADVTAILGGNFLRVARAVWK
ncbi:MAG TPA: membrane dipeptidase [Dongiaceae bacterium]|jgi:membrane dipeptidase|nr:membrane dipeptidase [Dongiaceae bacterium]